MRGRKRIGRGTRVGLVIALVAVVALGASLLLPGYGDNRAAAGSMAPQAVTRIAEKNNNAAINAAAAARARSAHDARIADQLQDQRDSANVSQTAR